MARFAVVWAVKLPSCAPNLLQQNGIRSVSGPDPTFVPPAIAGTRPAIETTICSPHTPPLGGVRQTARYASATHLAEDADCAAVRIFSLIAAVAVSE